MKDYLSVPDLPLDTKGTKFALPGGFVKGGDLASVKPIKSFNDAYFRDGVQESVKHSWYKGGKGALHPYKGETIPNYTDFQDDGKYSWVKSPTFYGNPAQVGPLSRVLAMAAQNHAPTLKYLTGVLDTAGSIAKTKIPLAAVHSTIGRHAARAVSCAVQVDELANQWNLLVENIGKGDTATFNKPVFPKGEVSGVGFHEAPRGVLSHWVVLDNGKITNYQAVVPTTWNAAPRNEGDVPGPYEASLLNTPVADEERPLEVLRTVHSFDPCLACAVHVLDAEGKPVVQVKVLVMRIVVLGVGNILLSDEGIGVRAIEKLQLDYVLPPEVVVVDGGTTGMEMLDDLSNADHIIIIDAVRSGKAPASIVRLADEQVPVFFKTKLSPHQIGLSDVLATLAFIGEQPGGVTVIGVEPVSLETGMSLSPQVEARLPELMDLVVTELRELGVVVKNAMPKAA